MIRRALVVLALAGSAGAAFGQSGTGGGAAAPLAIGDDSLRVVFWPGDRPLAERAWRAASQPFHLPGLPPGSSRISGTIFLAPTPAVFDSLTRGAPGWAAGVAIPSLRRIIVPAFQSSRTPMGDPISALRHEIAHLALHAYLPGNIPRWFNEGYATWASGEWDEGAGWQIRLALLGRDAPLLDSLTLDWPRMAGQARLAYLLSASAVHHLATRASGERAFTAFMQAWRREGSFDEALRSVYHLTPSRFELEWRAMVRNRYGWLLALSQAGVFWLVITVLFLILGTARRRYDAARLEALRAQDRMLPQPHPESYAGELGPGDHSQHLAQIEHAEEPAAWPDPEATDDPDGGPGAHNSPGHDDPGDAADRDLRRPSPPGNGT